MSDTPKTDAFEASVNRPMNWWDWARQLERENADLHDTIDAVIEADERAVDLWRAAHPGNEVVIPDRAKLVGWLLEQNAALRQALEDMPTCRCGLSTDEQCALSVENAALRKAKEMVELERCEMMRSMSLAQNQSEQLRKDKARLDFLSTLTGSGWACLHLNNKGANDDWFLTRKQIDRRMATEPKQ